MSDLEPPAWFDSAPPPSPSRGGQPAQQNAIAVPDEADVYEKAQPDQREMMEVLRNSLYPGATWGSIAMVLSYCKVHQLDPLLKCVHIVPMRVKLPGRNNYQWRDVLMPGIADYRVKASRSGEYVGKSEPIFGPVVEYELGNQKISVPEWCKVTVRRLVKGIVAEFPAIEFWIENYATAGHDTAAPNAMWSRRSRGQLMKTTEAQALRMAFPEFAIGNTAEEMEGKVLEEYHVVPAATFSEAPTDKLDAFEQLNGKMIAREDPAQTIDESLPPEKDAVPVATGGAAERSEAPPPTSPPDETERRPARLGDAPMTAPRLEVDKQALFFRDRIERLPTLARWKEFSDNPRFAKWLVDIAVDFPKIREEVLDALAEKQRVLSEDVPP
jgi:phage recombination protein Bet